MKIKAPSTAGLLSELRVVTLTYSRQGQVGWPAVVMVKFAPPDLKTRLTTDLFQLLRTEFKFYSGEIAKQAPFRTPKCYYADMNYTSNNFCLMMEMVSAEFRDQLAAPITVPDARQIFGALARLHAKWHGDKAEAQEVQFINKSDIDIFKMLKPEGLKAWKKVKARKQGGEGWTYQLPDDMIVLMPEVCKHTPLLGKLAVANPDLFGVTHGDPRLDNWFFFEDIGGPSVGALDFQLMLRTDVTSDLAWVFCTSCSAEFQEAHAQEMLDHYFAELDAAGGPSVAPGSEDRRMWEEQITMATAVAAVKVVIGCGGIDPGAPRVVPQMDQLLNNTIAMWQGRDVATTWRKFMAGELMAFARHPELGAMAAANGASRCDRPYAKRRGVAAVS